MLYNPQRRGIEHDLIPWCQRRGIPVMAYSPVGQGALLRNSKLAALAGEAWRDAGADRARLGDAARRRHRHPQGQPAGACARQRAALDIQLSADDLAELDRLFPPPRRKQPLEMI